MKHMLQSGIGRGLAQRTSFVGLPQEELVLCFCFPSSTFKGLGDAARQVSELVSLRASAMPASTCSPRGELRLRFIIRSLRDAECRGIADLPAERKRPGQLRSDSHLERPKPTSEQLTHNGKPGTSGQWLATNKTRRTPESMRVPHHIHYTNRDDSVAWHELHSFCLLVAGTIGTAACCCCRRIPAHRQQGHFFGHAQRTRLGVALDGETSARRQFDGPLSHQRR
mmetsp:Transcript_51313/g.133301  ORF Transcript_51313/g.133301 Transcript_51313/m.133301 type:complete len:225 (+) Transcript_51313:687-1361(+)